MTHGYEILTSVFNISISFTNYVTDPELTIDLQLRYI